MKSVKRAVAGLASCAIVGGGLLLAASSAHAAGTVDPAITGDANAQGTVSFFNATGTQIFSGSLSDLGGDYLMASSATTRTGTNKASLFAASPDHTKADSSLWNAAGLTAASNWPLTTAGGAPASLVAAEGAGVPVVHVGAGDGSLAGFFAGSVNDPTAGFDHIVQVRLEDSGPGKPAQLPFWQADVLIDTVANTWTQVFPAAPVLVNTSISTPVATPTSPAPAGTTSVALSSTLTAADSTHPAGSVELFNGATDLGPATLNAATGAITATATVANSTTYSFTLAYSPASGYNASTSSALAYTVQGPAAVTATTVSGPTSTTLGSAITLHADVKVGATAVPAGAGSVQFVVNGTNVGTPVLVTATGADFSYNPTATGSATVTGTFTPAAGQNFTTSTDTAGVTVITTAPSFNPDPQTVVVTVPTGTLVISTPYTAANPFNLGTLQLSADGTGLSTSAPFGSNAPAGTDPGTLDASPTASVTNGVTITDTRPGSTGWTASAQTTDFTGPAGNTTPIDGNNLSFTGVTPKYITGNHLQAGSVTPSDITAFKTAKKPFATTTQGPGTVNIYGTLGLTAPTSTLPGLYTATVTFTIV
ncbi:Ig-like domain repeat protein [Jatrophihabitans sp. DSM 45814]